MKDPAVPGSIEYIQVAVVSPMFSTPSVTGTFKSTDCGEIRLVVRFATSPAAFGNVAPPQFMPAFQSYGPKSVGTQLKVAAFAAFTAANVVAIAVVKINFETTRERTTRFGTRAGTGAARISIGDKELSCRMLPRI